MSFVQRTIHLIVGNVICFKNICEILILNDSSLKLEIFDILHLLLGDKNFFALCARQVLFWIKQPWEVCVLLVFMCTSSKLLLTGVNVQFFKTMFNPNTFVGLVGKVRIKLSPEGGRKGGWRKSGRARAGPGARTRDPLRARRGSGAARQGGCLYKQAFPCLQIG